MTQVAIDYDKLHEAVMGATETQSVTSSRPVVFLPEALSQVITQTHAWDKVDRCLSEYYGYAVRARPVDKLPGLESAEGTEKVHAHLSWAGFTLCGRPLGPRWGQGQVSPLNMDWFTREELVRVSGDRPCKVCLNIAIAQDWQR